MSRLNELARKLGPEGFWSWMLHQLDEGARVHLCAYREYRRKLYVRSFSFGLLRLFRFLHWQKERGSAWDDFSNQLLDDYSGHVLALPHSDILKGADLAAVRLWLKFLYRRKLILLPWHERLETPPRARYRLPKQALSLDQVQAIMAIPDTSTPLGLRDRAILETAYSTGLRRGELGALQLCSLDLCEGSIHVDLGKNGRSRVAPLTDYALGWVRRYLQDGRPPLVRGWTGNALWLSQHGKPFPMNDFLNSLHYRYPDMPTFGLHQLRAAFATHLLQAGAPLASVQHLLGHIHPSSTQYYTLLSLKELHKMHHRCHPLENR